MSMFCIYTEPTLIGDDSYFGGTLQIKMDIGRSTVTCIVGSKSRSMAETIAATIGNEAMVININEIPESYIATDSYGILSVVQIDSKDSLEDFLNHKETWHLYVRRYKKQGGRWVQAE